MIALASYLRARAEGELRIVFIGPCIAKKVEARDTHLQREVDSVLTFGELRELLQESAVQQRDDIVACDFDPPHGRCGALYPLSRGALQAAGLREDLMTGDIVATQGRAHMRNAIQEFADGNLGAKLLEVLCCDGCIMGAGMTHEMPLFVRRQRVSDFAGRRIESLDTASWRENIASASDLTLSRSFDANDQRSSQPDAAELQQILVQLGKPSHEDELNCGACGYETCREHAVAIYRGLAENEMCLPHTIDRLSAANRQLEDSHHQLASAQEALMHSEKLASMGQLAAGIAHEVNNPLGIVLMYAHLLLDECTEKDQKYDDIQMIVEQADRCKHIVGGLLHFAAEPCRQELDRHLSVGPQRRHSDFCTGRRGVVCRKPTGRSAHDIDKEQMAQVVTNLVNNALAATPPAGTVLVRCWDDDSHVRISVIDTGTGIEKETLKKIFEPFFTTKQPGQGTGLGLSVSYGIVKMHCGDITVQTNADPTAGPTGTAFTVRLPRH